MDTPTYCGHALLLGVLYGGNLHSYTKLDINGNHLADEAPEGIMARDNVTSLIGEVKTDDFTMHNNGEEYNWV